MVGNAVHGVGVVQWCRGAVVEKICEGMVMDGPLMISNRVRHNSVLNFFWGLSVFVVCVCPNPDLGTDRGYGHHNQKWDI